MMEALTFVSFSYADEAKGLLALLLTFSETVFFFPLRLKTRCSVHQLIMPGEQFGCIDVFVM